RPSRRGRVTMRGRPRASRGCRRLRLHGAARRRGGTGGYRRFRVTDWNQKIIEEFRTNEGRVGGNFEGRTLLLLHHTGAKTGTERINPLAYQRLSDNAVAVFASKGGAPKTPDWFHNLVAHPNVQVQIGTETFSARARVAEGA